MAGQLFNLPTKGVEQMKRIRSNDNEQIKEE